MNEMNVALVYYSRTENTRNAFEFLKHTIEQKNVNVDMIRIIPEKDPGFFKAMSASRNQEELPIKNKEDPLLDYQTIIVGAPSWAYYPAPFYKSYLRHVKDLDKKKIGICLCAGVSIQRNMITMKRYTEEMKTLGISSIDADLIIIVRKGKIVDGQQHVKGFIEKLF
jgi:flavorubredoxin